MRMMKLLRDQLGAVLRPPPGFGWVPGGVHRRGATYDVGRGPRSWLFDAGANYYVDRARPNNGGNGLTPATAKRDIWAALNVLPFPDVGPVNLWIKSGTYDLAGGWAASSILSRANIIATANLATASLASWEPGRVRTTASPLTLVWALDSGSTYAAALAAAPYAVIDEAQPTSSGAGSRLTLQASVAAVEANPGSYHHAAGVLYVRTADSRAPDANVHALKAVQNNGKASLAGVSFNVFDVDFVGGSRSFYLQAGTAAVFSGCRFRYGELEGLGAEACADVRLFDCESDENTRDGVAYTNVTRGLEVRCRGRRNGFSGLNIDNASSMHTGGSMVRIGGTYSDSAGINVADVQDTRSWLLGCSISGTRSTDNSRKVNFWTEGLAYLERCTLANNTIDLHADQVGDVIRVWDTPYVGPLDGLGAVRVARG